jgi:hypothetical protein
VSVEAVQDNFIIEGYGTVTYPEGTRVYRIVVPPGVVFIPPDGVLVEEIG